MRRLQSVFSLVAVALFTAGGCNDHESALNPAGPQANEFNHLWWLYFYVSLAVYSIMILLVFVGAAVRWSRSRSFEPAIVRPPARGETIRAVLVGGGLVATVATLFVLLVADYVTGRTINQLADSSSLKIRVIGHQWWWEVRYEDPEPSNLATTANEIHIPVGRTVDFELSSTDVIHSFWVPNLHGKRDLIPGHPTHIFLQADEAGDYLGQCAEFCGEQHANMRLAVIAEQQSDFDAWLERQRQPARQPSTDSEKRGQSIFLTTSCVMCHAIQGTAARASFGPDLTHVASRARIGANTLDNTLGHLGGWIADPQRIKPGVRMPVNPLKPDDLRSLLDYLQSLK